MNKYFVATLFFSFLVPVLFGSCSDNKDLNKKVQGHWVINNAARNGRITYTLEGAYIKFYNNNSLETNISGNSIITGYVFKENTLVPDSFLSEIFVDKINMDTLWLHTTISNNLFSLQLINKSKNEKNISY